MDLTLVVLKVEYSREIFVNTMAVDGLAPCVARPSAAMILSIQDKRVIDSVLRNYVGYKLAEINSGWQVWPQLIKKLYLSISGLSMLLLIGGSVQDLKSDSQMVFGSDEVNSKILNVVLLELFGKLYSWLYTQFSKQGSCIMCGTLVYKKKN